MPDTTVSPAAAAALALLPETTHLVEVDYDDQLTDDQIAEALAGEHGPGTEAFDDWWSEARREGARYELGQLPDEVRDALSSDDEDLVIEAIEERDRSNAYEDLAGRSRDRLFAYKIGDPDANADEVDVDRCWHPRDEEDVAEAQRAKLRAILGPLGIDVDLPANAEAVASIVAENVYHGGVVAVLWYGPPGPWIDLVGGEPYEEPTEGVLERPGTTITFTDPQVLVWNGWGGAGYFEQLTGELTIPWDPERLNLCQSGGQWDVDACFGLYLPAVAAQPTITKPEEAP